MSATCTLHCRGYPYGGCDGHFSSLKAFDAHRQGPHDGERVCVDAADAGLEGHKGRCKLQRPPVDGEVTIWSVPMTDADRERLRNMASAVPGSPESGSEGPGRP